MRVWHLFPPIPEVSPVPQEKFPGLSNKIEIKYTNDSGRYAVAAEDINTGDYLVTEKPFAAVLTYEKYGTHCQTCFLT